MATAATAATRLGRDYKELINEPLSNVRAAPLPTDIRRWYFVFVGDADSAFAGGYYYGTIVFTNEYPFKPPSYRLLTQNGRMSVGHDVCISNSNYHAETWSPLWSLSGLLTGFVAFFHDLTQKNFAGSVHDQKQSEMERIAKESKAALVRIPEMNELFPDVVEQIKREIDGAPVTHKLPFPPEYAILQQKKQDSKKVEAAEKASELALENMYDEDDNYDSDDNAQEAEDDDDVATSSSEEGASKMVTSVHQSV